MSRAAKLEVLVSCGCLLGEGPLWDHRRQRLFWVDIKAPAVWMRDAAGEVSRYEAPERIGFVALTRDEHVLLAGLKSGLAMLDLRTGRARPLIAPEPDLPHNRINDGTVAADGSVLFGTMDDEQKQASGGFWRYAEGRLTRFGAAAVVTNGPAVSAHGETLYAVDSMGRTIFAHDLANGVPGAARVFARFAEEWGHPDGLAVDAEDHVWVCHWGGSRISRFRPDGTVERVLPVPTANVTKCAFGGDGLRTLFVTTASEGRPPSDRLAGHLFAAEAPAPGVRAHIAGVDP